jgi:hypothetical protein
MYLVYNPNTEGQQQYAEEQKRKYDNFEFDNLKEIKIIKEEYILNYHKIFINEKQGSFHPVEPVKKVECVSGYLRHVKSIGKRYLIDKENKILIIYL